MRAMLDQNLLDKQCILETLLDLLEKSVVRPQAPVATTTNPGSASQPSFASSSTSGLGTAGAKLGASQSSTALMPQLNSASGVTGEGFTTKMLMATILQNMHYYLQSEILCRRLAYFSCKKIANMFNDYANCFFESAIKQLQQQHQSGTGSSSVLPSSLSMSGLLLTNQQKSPELGSTLQLTSSMQSTSTTPPTKLKPFVTNLTATATTPNPTKFPQTPVSNKQAPFESSVAVNEVINYQLVNSVSMKSVSGICERN